MNTCISPKARGQRMNTTITTATTVFDLFRASDVETLRYILITSRAWENLNVRKETKTLTLRRYLIPVTS